MAMKEKSTEPTNLMMLVIFRKITRKCKLYIVTENHQHSRSDSYDVKIDSTPFIA